MYDSQNKEYRDNNERLAATKRLAELMDLRHDDGVTDLEKRKKGSFMTFRLLYTSFNKDMYRPYLVTLNYVERKKIKRSYLNVNA